MRHLRLLTVVAVLLALAPVGAASAAPDRTLVVAAGETTTWNGAPAIGANAYYYGVVGPPAPASVGPVAQGTCSKDVYHYCEQTLIQLSNPLTQMEIDKGITELYRSVTVRLSDYGPAPDPLTDFDLLMFASDQNGTVGPELDSDGDLTDTANETVTAEVATTVAAPSVYVLVRVVYFTSANSGYKATLMF